MSSAPAPTTVPEPNRQRVARWVPIVTRALAVVLVLLIAGSVGLYFAVRAPTQTLNTFLADLRASRDAHAWTLLCASDQREVPQSDFVADWQRQRAKYGAVITEIDAFSFEPFGSVRHFHYRLVFRDDKVPRNIYDVDVLRDAGQWKVCNFFSLSRNPKGGGVLSGFQNP